MTVQCFINIFDSFTHVSMFCYICDILSSPICLTKIDSMCLWFELSDWNIVTETFASTCYIISQLEFSCCVVCCAVNLWICRSKVVWTGAPLFNVDASMESHIFDVWFFSFNRNATFWWSLLFVIWSTKFFFLIVVTLPKVLLCWL